MDDFWVGWFVFGDYLVWWYVYLGFVVVGCLLDVVLCLVCVLGFDRFVEFVYDCVVDYCWVMGYLFWCVVEMLVV